jgi:Fe-S-cluster containining protein
MSSYKIDIDKLKKQAKLSEVENKSLFAKLKKKKPKNLDSVVHQLHQEVFEKIDCLECANCCKSISPIITDKDIERLSKHLRMKPSKFIEKYIIFDNDTDYVYSQAPCPYLMADNYCMVYEQRPKACREYPHTDRKKLYQLLPITLKNTFYCPAVYEIVEELKKQKNIF